MVVNLRSLYINEKREKCMETIDFGGKCNDSKLGKERRK